MKFVNKVGFTCSIIRFVDICTDRSGTSYDLIDKYTSAFASIHFITNSDYMQSKCLCSCAQF